MASSATIVFCNGKRVLAKQNGRGKWICGGCDKQLNFLVQVGEAIKRDDEAV